MALSETGGIPVWSLRDRLRKARETADLTQDQLAEKVGVSRVSVIAYETGKVVPKRPVLLSWAVTCRVDYAWLAGSPHPGMTNLGDQSDVTKSPKCTPSKALPAAA